MSTKMVMSKRLYSILPTEDYMEVKLNGNLYKIQFRMELWSTSETNIILYKEIDEYNFFCFNKNNKITCWPVKKGEQPLNEKGQWKLEGRTEMKPGKFLLLLQDDVKMWDEDDSRIYDDTLCNKVFARACEIFTDAVKGYNEPLSFDMSKNIGKVYGMESHENSGYLLNSCMRPGSEHECNNYPYFYDLIRGLKVVHKIVNNSLLFRALLWKAKDKNGHSITFLDRIYGTDAINNRLIEYAKANGWAWRSFSNNTIYHKDEQIDLCCPITEKAYEYLENAGSPYVDSLYKLIPHDGKYMLSNYENKYDSIYLQSCNGDALPHRECRHCGKRLDEGDSYFYNDNEYCEDCYCEYFSSCEKCDETYCRDDILYVAVDGDETNICQNCLDDYHVCIDCGSYVSDVSESGYCEVCETRKLLTWEETLNIILIKNRILSKTEGIAKRLGYEAYDMRREYKVDANNKRYDFEFNAINIINQQMLQLNEC